MEQERERQRTGSQPKDSQQSTLPFVSVADTFHYFLLDALPYLTFFPFFFASAFALAIPLGV
jgi:hypothetical protein|tara:strand:- start:241 stop:426 length:186 start_codon:yes stop_codon:yes gene_type:complete